MVKIEHLSKTFIQNGIEVKVFGNINLEVKKGEFVSLIGASGCGKSTLLRLIAGLIQPDSGTMLANGEPITAPSPTRGFAFQEHALFPWLNIYSNIAFGLKMLGTFKNNKSLVNEWIERVGLKGFEKSFSHQLSGGMCQRAALARSFIVRPDLLLLDEPLGALDAFTRMNMQDEILRIQEQEKTTMIMVTHDVDEAVYMSDRVVVMSPRPGRIRKIINIELPRPRSRISGLFTERRNKLLDILHFGGEEKEEEYKI
ncbi:ABC transporter ATP-binding protein [Fibrobacterales bacterium]|nr:ABC transporter ATP-binding protein [Fibrobacterales bacterium]